MYKAIVPILGIVILAILGCLFYQSCENRHYRYQIDYSHGKYPGTDYTDAYRLDSNRIEYTNQFGRRIIRCGDFSVQENTDYSKK